RCTLRQAASPLAAPCTPRPRVADEVRRAPPQQGFLEEAPELGAPAGLFRRGPHPTAAAPERSRRGAHLWIFFEKPLLARHCRIYIYNLARRLKVPVKGRAGLAEGIEVFPRQDELAPEEFGNAIRGPLGIHRGAGKRYWFYGADYKIEAQLAYLERLKKITETEMLRFI